MTRPLGRLYLVPNTLDFGVAGETVAIGELLPRAVLGVAARLEHWAAENAKSARAFLKRVDAVAPLRRPLQEIRIVELPRPAKGRAEAIDAAALEPLLAPALSGDDVGLLSEAGLAAVADPGAALVATAHRLGVAVRALPGASALTLAVAASGLNGQSFAFVGYVPVDARARAKRIVELEQASRRLAQTQVLIETPYRNQALLDALLATLQTSTRLAVSVGLATAREETHSDAIAHWRAAASPLPADVPAVFSFLAS